MQELVKTGKSPYTNKHSDIIFWIYFLLKENTDLSRIHLHSCKNEFNQRAYPVVLFKWFYYCLPAHCCLRLLLVSVFAPLRGQWMFWSGLLSQGCYDYRQCWRLVPGVPGQIHTEMPHHPFGTGCQNKNKRVIH